MAVRRFPRKLFPGAEIEIRSGSGTILGREWALVPKLRLNRVACRLGQGSSFLLWGEPGGGPGGGGPFEGFPGELSRGTFPGNFAWRVFGGLPGNFAWKLFLESCPESLPGEFSESCPETLPGEFTRRVARKLCLESFPGEFSHRVSKSFAYDASKAALNAHLYDHRDPETYVGQGIWSFGFGSRNAGSN